MVETGATSSISMSSQEMPALLQRLMSNPPGPPTLEEIERHQRSEMHRDQMPKPAGEEAPPANHMPILSYSPVSEPDSPNTALKRTLNILPINPQVGSRPKTSNPSGMTSSSVLPGSVGLSSSAGASLLHRTQSDQSFGQIGSLDSRGQQMTGLKLPGAGSSTNHQVADMALPGIKPIVDTGLPLGPGGDSKSTLSLAPSLPGQVSIIYSILSLSPSLPEYVNILLTI